MFHNNPLLFKLKKKLSSKTSRIEGIVKSTDKGFGFLEIDSNTSYFIPPTKMKKVMHGDRITALLKIENFREIADPEKLIEPFLTRFVGKIQINQSVVSIIPNYPFLKTGIVCIVSCNLPKHAKTGDWATAILVKHKLISGHHKFLAKLTEYIINKEDFLAPWLVTLAHYQLESQCHELNSSSITFDSSVLRKDLTHLNFITIDSITTRDIDDAVYVESYSQGVFDLIVAIADSTSYIPLSSSLDKYALERSYTNYLPGLTIPMLPLQLSEHKCSLELNRRRPVLACKIRIDKDGSILHNYTYFFLAWIKSKAKLVYEHVSDWLEHTGHWIPESRDTANQLCMLNDIFIIRNSWRKNYALLFQENPEYRFKLSNDFKVSSISLENRRIAHKIIEEVMITANICAAQKLSEKLGFGIYNVHLGFDSTNSEYIAKLLCEYGIVIDSKEIQTLEGFCKLKRFLNNNSYRYLNNRIAKSQSFAEIQCIPGPHFSLGLKNYATWTSPIRKYSDMINHRLLKSIVTDTNATRPGIDVLLKINNRRKLLKMAERDIIDWLYIQFFSSEKYQNKIFKAEIVDVFKSGIKVKSLKYGANIFIPASFLHDFHRELFFNHEKGTVYINEKKIYCVSDIIKVKLINVRINTRSLIGKPI